MVSPAWSQTTPNYAEDLAPYLKVGSFDALSDLAEDIAREAFQPIPAPAKVLTDLSYPDYQKIEFLHHRGIWAGGKTPYWFETFHRGYIQEGKIEVFTCLLYTSPSPRD